MLNYQLIFHRHPTFIYHWDRSRTFGNTLNSRKTTKTTRGGLCAMSVQTNILPFPVQLQLCGTTYIAFTSLRSPQSPSNHAELSINFPQRTDLYVPSRSNSDIWKYFKRTKEDKNHKTWAVCNECPDKTLAFNGVTSSMWHHMRRVHSIENPSRLK